MFMMEKKIVLIFVSVLFSLSLMSQNSVQYAVNKLKNDVDLKNAGISILVVDLSNNKVVAALNPDLSLKPASTMKLLTTAAALETLGADYTFSTKLFYNGEIDTLNRTLHGDIIIRGGGDPTLGSGYFYSTKKSHFVRHWIDDIKKLGIDTIKGRVIADASVFSTDIVPPKWTWEDLGNYFGAGPCGLTIFDNMYTLHFRTSSVVGGKTEIIGMQPQIKSMVFDNQVKSANIYSDKSYIYGSPYCNYRYIRGELPRNKKDFKVRGSLPDPAMLAAQILNDSLQKQNIVLRQNPSTLRLLGTHIDYSKVHIIDSIESPKLSDIVHILNMMSINLFAEDLLLQTSIRLADVNNTPDAADVLKNFWKEKGMDVSGMVLNDGSGLSYYDYVDARQLVFVLRYMYKKSKNFEVFYKSLPVAGISGTLENVGKRTAARGKIHAKSGSLSKVRCYAGYAKTRSGKKLAFAFMLNNFNCSDYKAKKKLEKLMIAMALMK